MTEDDDRVGHRRLDLAAELDLGLVVLGDLQHDRSRKPPTSPARVMLTISGGKISGCLPNARTARCRPRRLADLAQHLGELLVLGLLGRMFSARSSDRPGVDHRRELPRHDREVLELDLRTELGSLISVVMPELLISLMLTGA